MRMKLAEWLVHRYAKLVSQVHCPARSTSMMHIYFTDIKIQASIMWLAKKKKTSACIAHEVGRVVGELRCGAGFVGSMRS